MLPIDSLVFDLVLRADAQPPQDLLVAALGGKEAAAKHHVIDVDYDVPQYEMEVSPSVPLRGREERRLLFVDPTGAPMRKDPRADPIVPRDLRPARDKLVELVRALGARWGRLYAFGSWGDAAVVVKNARDLRGLFLLGWALDPRLDVEGRTRSGQLTKREFEEKLNAFPLRLDELDDETILARVPPGHMTRDELIVVDVLSDLDGSWDLRHSAALEDRLAAKDLFARIPGARVRIEPPPAPEPEAPAAPEPEILGEPIEVVDAGGPVAVVPPDRFDLDFLSALGRRAGDWRRRHDRIPAAARQNLGAVDFLAPLSFLSEVFVEGKPLDKKTFAATAQEIPGGKAMEVHLPRFGAATVVEVGGRRFVTSVGVKEVARVIPLTAKVPK